MAVTALPADYAERVYAGVLGKLIGVYLGRPVEGWSYDRITAAHGEVDRYLEDSQGAPLIVSDDDIAGTFTFLRAMPDHGNDPALTAAQIGNTWLNYIIEGKTIIWFGGIGDSTEHTAYLHLKQGIPAPASGSIALNGTTVAEQIGSQIFIDGWGMIAPGDPELAADFARRAGSVSHDGEAIYGAQVIAAMEAQAFVESDLNTLLDTALSLIPADSIIARLIGDVREWHAIEPDWRRTRQRIAERYGPETYGGNCHMAPNHALIILALLYGDDDFRRSLMIVNTAGWDTDCNSGNVGCLLGIKNGLAGIDGSDYDWRGPVADRLYLATADGGRAITDAVRETYEIVNIGRALAGEPPLRPKDGARFHFSLPGAVQGFTARWMDTESSHRIAVAGSTGDAGIAPTDPRSSGRVPISNDHLRSGSGVVVANEERALAVRWDADRPEQTVMVTTPTFTPPEAIAMPFYPVLASPTLYPGQVVRVRVAADVGNAGAVDARLMIRYYGSDDTLQALTGSPQSVAPGSDAGLAWRIPDLGGAPVAEVGIAAAPAAAGAGALSLDWLTWDGPPDVTLGRPAHGGQMWRRAWVDAADRFYGRRGQPYRVSQDRGTGLVSQGTAEWSDYRVSADVTILLARQGGIAARVGGMRRWYALLLGDDGMARLVKDREALTVLAERSFPWERDRPYRLSLTVRGPRISGEIDGLLIADVVDDTPMLGGGIGLIVTEGTLASGPVRVEPVS